MKKISFMLICMLTFCICCTGCNKLQTPGDQVSLILEQIKDSDIDADVQSLFPDKKLGKKYADEYKELADKIKDFDFKIIDESISDDEESAVVTVQITTYDFASAYDKTRDDAGKAAKKGKLDRDSNIADYTTKAMLKNMLELDKKSVATEVKIDCTLNEDGDWTPAIEEHEDLIDAILGGLISKEKLKVKKK